MFCILIFNHADLWQKNFTVRTRFLEMTVSKFPFIIIFFYKLAVYTIAVAGLAILPLVGAKVIIQMMWNSMH
jgi:hypothetical protein